MENGLSTLQKYFRIQRVVVIIFFLMMAVSLLLPYTKTHFATPTLPGISTTIHIHGYEFRLVVLATILVFICTLLITVAKTKIPAIIGFFVAVLSGIMLLILPQEIHFRHIFIKQSHNEYTFQVGFYTILIGGIGIIITALINLIVVIKNTPREHSANPDLIDDLE